MILTSEKSVLAGEVVVPASKSHTIRALALATLARGRSAISNPLDSADTRACVDACGALGAKIETGGEPWTVEGVAGRPRVAEDIIDVKNSGTTLYIALGMAALADGWNVLTGDDQTRRRTAQNLIQALSQLGARVESMRANGQYELFSKKEVARYERERKKLEKNLSGIKEMNGLPDALFVIDTKLETRLSSSVSR